MCDIKCIIRFVAVFAICMIVISCGVPKYIQKNFTYLYDGKSVGIDSLINTNGYFTIAKSETRRKYIKPYIKGAYVEIRDTFYMNYLFFKDGMFLQNFWFYDCISPKCIPEKFKEIVNEALGNKSSFANSGYWGRYVISGDTIKAQYLNNPSPPKVWIAYEEWFKVLNRNTIIEIDSKPIHYMSESDWVNWKRNKKGFKYLPAVFVPASVIPNSDSWLKNEKWFWKSSTTKNKNNGG